MIFYLSSLLLPLLGPVALLPIPVHHQELSVFEKKMNQASQAEKEKKKRISVLFIDLFLQKSESFFFGLPFLFSSPLSRILLLYAAIPSHSDAWSRSRGTWTLPPRECVQATLARASWGLCVSVCCFFCRVFLLHSAMRREVGIVEWGNWAELKTYFVGDLKHNAVNYDSFFPHSTLQSIRALILLETSSFLHCASCVRSLQPAAKICASASDSLSRSLALSFRYFFAGSRSIAVSFGSSMCAWLKDHAWWWWIRVFLFSLFFGLSFLSEMKMKISARKSTTNCGEGKVNDLGNDVALDDPDTSRSVRRFKRKKVNTNSPSAVSIAMHLPPTQSHMTLNAAAQRSPPLYLLRDCVYIFLYNTEWCRRRTRSFFRNCPHCARAAAHDDHRRGAEAARSKHGGGGKK